MTPKIIMKRVALLGYTPETQCWFVMNGGGGDKTVKQLKRWQREGDLQLALHCGQHYNALKERGNAAARDFARDAQARGFEVEWSHI